MGRPHHNQFDWTTDIEKTLVQLYDRGLSASQIIKEMSLPVSRNAVVGKLHRLGAVRNPELSRQVLKASRVSRTPAPKMNIVTKILRSEQKPKGVGIGKTTGSALALVMNGPPTRPTSDGPAAAISGAVPGSRNLCISDPGFKIHGCCKWPTGGAGALMTFCAITVDQGSYCKAHAAIAYKPLPQRGRHSPRKLVRSLRRYS